MYDEETSLMVCQLRWAHTTFQIAPSFSVRISGTKITYVMVYDTNTGTKRVHLGRTGQGNLTNKYSTVPTSMSVGSWDSFDVHYNNLEKVATRFLRFLSLTTSSKSGRGEGVSNVRSQLRFRSCFTTKGIAQMKRLIVGVDV